ncbi:MAG: PEP-CTERM system histidine kinase PrsK [Chromatiales bacterium]|nr:PEP-CTERM system histidine kinase PrsK [Chromatiales bacterium]
MDVTELLGHHVVWYGASGLVYAVFAVGLLIRGGGLLRQNMLAVAVAGIVWSGYFAVTTGDLTVYRLDSATFFIEILFMLTWFALLYRLLRGPYRQSMPETVRRSLFLFWALVLLSGAVIAWFVYLGDGSARAVSYYHIIGLGVALMCFGLSAQLNRDAPIENTLTLHSIAAAGGVFAGSQALLLGVATLAGSGPSLILIVRILAVGGAGLILLYAVRRRPQWSLDIFVSPQARAYLPRLLPMLVVLIVLLALTPLTRTLHEAYVQSLAGLLFVLVGVPIAVLMFSENLSARLRVFISKNFLPFRFDYREEWLRLIDTLSSPEQRVPLPERSIRAVAQIVGAPAGLLFWRGSDQESYWCTATWNTRIWPDFEVRHDEPALRFMCNRQWILDTAELDRDPELYDGLRRPWWTEQLPDALLIVPLISNEELLGFTVLFQSSSAFRLTFEEIDLLRTSGRQVAAHLAQYEGDRQLAEAQQFEAFNRLTAFVMHDLKNLIAQQSLMVKNAAKHKDNPAFFEDAMATIENSVARMNKLLRQLKSGDTSGPTERTLLSDALLGAIGSTENHKPEPRFENNGESLAVNIDRERFTTVVAHLIRNAQEATSADGSVIIRLNRDKDAAIIRIEDDGCGMPADFIRNRLFRPFDSTKGSKGMGIGAYQARTFVVDAGGSLEVESEPGHGTVVVIRMPMLA